MKKKILFIGSRKKYSPFFNYCRKKGYDFFIFEAVQGLPNNCMAHERKKIFNGYAAFFNVAYYVDFCLKNQFIPDFIINLRDQEKWLYLEYELIHIFRTQNFFDLPALQFFSLKSEQDKIYKKLSIPTIPLTNNQEEEIIVKKDSGFSGGHGFYITKLNLYKPRENEFIQSRLNIKYTIGVHLYIDKEGSWYILNFHQLKYFNNCAYISKTPYTPQKADKDLINDSICKIAKYLNVCNRLVFWQFIKDKNDNLYSMDFNCRVSGGFEAGSYDTDISKVSWAEILIEQSPVPDILFSHQVSCIYNKQQYFGYSSCLRKKSPIRIKKMETQII